MARKLDYWDFDRDEIVVCPECGWSGRAGDHIELYSEVFDVSCVQCEKMLIIVRSFIDFTSEDDIEAARRAAAAGNQEAVDMLAKFEALQTDSE